MKRNVVVVVGFYYKIKIYYKKGIRRVLKMMFVKDVLE